MKEYAARRLLIYTRRKVLEEYRKYGKIWKLLEPSGYKFGATTEHARTLGNIQERARTF